MKPGFSIRYKFLIVMTALLVVCVGAYLWLAISEFKSDKASLVFDYNRSYVTNVASDLESFITGVSDKMRLVALIYREPEAKRKALLADLMSDGEDLIYVAGTDQFTQLDREFYVNEEFLKTYGLDKETFLSAVGGARPIPLTELQLAGEMIWNSSVTGFPPLVGMGRLVVEEDHRGVPVQQFGVIGFVRADRLLQAVGQGGLNDALIASEKGELLMHSEADRIFQASAVDDRLFEIAKADSTKKKVFEYHDGGEKFLGAYAKARRGQIIVLSKVSENKAFRAVNRLVLRSLLFATTVLTMAFIAAIIFSRSLTRPIDTLMSGMRKVSEGDLSGQIKVGSRDEIALLAQSFNRMIEDLRASRDELETINRELENKVKERTFELEQQNQAVKEAQEALLKSTRLAAIGEVAGQAAHEVLNPLTSIVSRLQKLKTRIAEDRKRELQVLFDIQEGWKKDYSEGGFKKLVETWQKTSGIKPNTSIWDEDVENIRAVAEKVQGEFITLDDDTTFLIQETERIGRIVQSFRSLSAVRAEPKMLSAHEVCQRSIKIMADLAGKVGVKLSAELRAPTDMVLADEDELIQVLTNLIRNGIQSAKSKSGGEVRLVSEISTSSIDIHVRDNGGGIAPELQKKLFEKNFTTKSRDEGTGIGLSISRRLVRAFKGDLFLAKSSPGQGADFVMRLPLANSAERRKSA